MGKFTTMTIRFLTELIALRTSFLCLVMGAASPPCGLGCRHWCFVEGDAGWLLRDSNEGSYEKGNLRLFALAIESTAVMLAVCWHERPQSWAGKPCASAESRCHTYTPRIMGARGRIMGDNVRIKTALESA